MSTTNQETRRGWTGWIEERLGLVDFYQKYGRKVFPVHSTFFLGEIALFSFVILVLTGIYLGLIYTPSNAEVTIDGETVPSAYASVLLIESIPVASLFRNVHHWAAHVMVAAVFLHTMRVYFSGTYRKPREINWLVGVLLLMLTLFASFVGYALPYDSYAVTATGIGYSIARSVPWLGDVASELLFGGNFPTLGSLPRLYTLHVFVLPALITATIGLHLLIMVKQKHTQPGYARRLAEPGKVLGVPALPYQALLAGELLLFMFGALFLLAAFVPPHPLEAYGPPGPASGDVKPDWYLLWIYGFLKIVPSDLSFELLGGDFEPDFFGGVLFPGLIFAVIALVPWLDRTNRGATRRFEYLEPARQAPLRLALGLALLAYVVMLFVAAYYDEIGFSLTQMWLLSLAVPAVVGAGAYALARRSGPREPFDATAEAGPDGEDHDARPPVQAPEPGDAS